MLLLNKSRPQQQRRLVFHTETLSSTLLPTKQLMNVLPRLKLLIAMTTFTPLTVFLFKSFTTKKSIYMEPVQGLNLNRRYMLGLESEMPVTYSPRRNIKVGSSNL